MENNDKILEEYEILGLYGVRKTLIEKYKQYDTEIRKLISDGKDIPSLLAKRYFLIFEELDWARAMNLNRKNKRLSEEHAKQAIDYFSKFDEYHFSGRKRMVVSMAFINEGKDFKLTIPYSLNNMIEVCITAFAYRGEGHSLSKDDVIKYFCDGINNYSTSYLSRQHKQILTTYKRRVIAAYMALCVGMRLFDKSKKVFTDFTNDDLFQATRNAFRAKKIKA